jgi:hypothetical protein
VARQLFGRKGGTLGRSSRGSADGTGREGEEGDGPTAKATRGQEAGLRTRGQEQRKREARNAGQGQEDLASPSPEPLLASLPAEVMCPLSLLTPFRPLHPLSDNRASTLLSTQGRSRGSSGTILRIGRPIFSRVSTFRWQPTYLPIVRSQQSWQIHRLLPPSADTPP